MAKTLTLDGVQWPRFLSFFSGIGMMVASILTIRHYFLANYPKAFSKDLSAISALFSTVIVLLFLSYPK